MSAPDQIMQEMEAERFQVELDICKRIAKFNEQDALYVASSFGLKQDFIKEIRNAQHQ